MGFIRTRYAFSKDIKDELLGLRALDNWHGIVAAFYDYAVIISAMYLTHLSAWMLPVTILLVGSRQRAFATLLHESAHCTLASSRRLNYFLGTYMSGYLILQEYYTYRDSHVKKHHAFLGDSNEDPDYHFHKNIKLYEYHGCFHFFISYIMKHVTLLKTGSYLWYLITYRMKPSKKYFTQFMKMLAYWLVIITLFASFDGLMYLVIWFVSLLTSASIIGWFNEMAEHYPLMGKYKCDLYMTRNRFSHGLEHFLFNTHDEHLHLVHHLQATIPFWRLRQAHKILCKDPEYKRLNDQMGGIFISGNKNPSLMSKLLNEPAISRDGMVQYE